MDLHTISFRAPEGTGTNATVELDGQKLKGVKKLIVTAVVGEMVKIELDMIGLVDISALGDTVRRYAVAKEAREE